MPSYAIIYHLISVHMLLAIKESYHQCFKCLSSVKERILRISEYLHISEYQFVVYQ